MGLRDFERSDGIPKTINIRPGTDREVNIVKDLDLKCYHYPWGPEQWSETVGTNPAKWCLAMDKDRAVGFAIWRDSPDEVTLEKLGVIPDSRRRGTGTKLLRHVIKYSRSSRARQVTLLVPEINCFPGHPDDVSQWLLGRRFRAKPPIVRNHAFMYGQWVDGFQFVRPIEEGTNEPTT